MEPISNKSRIRPCSQTFAVDIADTHMSFQKHYETYLSPTTALNTDQRQFSFAISPNISAELHIPSCELLVSMKLVLEDGSTIAATDQVGIIQCFSALMWENSFVRINGQNYLPELGYNDHFEYMRIMGCYTERERTSLLHSYGYRKDTPKRSGPTQVIYMEQAMQPVWLKIING